jgi:hypothetical protein
MLKYVGLRRVGGRVLNFARLAFARSAAWFETPHRQEHQFFSARSLLHSSGMVQPLLLARDRKCDRRNRRALAGTIVIHKLLNSPRT